MVDPLSQQDVYNRQVRIHLKSQVERLLLEEGTAAGIILTDGSVHRAEAVIVATGGLSYPTTGSTGDGYRFAREAGHTAVSYTHLMRSSGKN